MVEEEIWRQLKFGTTNYLSVHIKNSREKLERVCDSERERERERQIEYV